VNGLVLSVARWMIDHMIAGVIGAIFGGPPFWYVWQLLDRNRDRRKTRRQDVSR
jgi:hypothetical protein